MTGLFLFVAALFPFLALLQALPYSLLFAYLAMNGSVTLLYGMDKWQAFRHRPRIPEKILILSTLIGGVPGALVGQYIFRHKTKKYLFLIIDLLGIASLYALLAIVTLTFS
ncbi:MAG: DUF1294 domain-containing protein [Agitococcus sp.]|nr:DUF1294 domain-containing protein [Agitococcus sp.]MDO9179132.1 DUF1294 domain-containing protein [Agitococcus sp.]